VAERVDTLLPYSNPATPPLFMLMTLTQNCLPFVINYQYVRRAGASLDSGKEGIDICRSATLPNCGILVSTSVCHPS